MHASILPQIAPRDGVACPPASVSLRHVRPLPRGRIVPCQLPRIGVIADRTPRRVALASLLGGADCTALLFASVAAFRKEAGPMPHALILDLARRSQPEALAAVARLRAALPGLPILFTCPAGDIRLAVCAMRAGATDVIELPGAEDAMLAQLRAALAAAPPPPAPNPDRAAAEKMRHLPRRQMDVLRHLLAGASNRCIADDLGLSPRTVEHHRARLMLVVRAESIVDLVRLSVLAGIHPA